MNQTDLKNVKDLATGKTKEVDEKKENNPKQESLLPAEQPAPTKTTKKGPAITAMKQIPQELPTLTFYKKALAAKEKSLNNFLGDSANALRFLSACSQAIEKTPKLLECDVESVIGAFMECAALALYPGSASGDCYVLPFRVKGVLKAQFQLGYRGYKTLAYRAGIARCGAEVVYENDTFKETLGTAPRIDHIKAEGDRGAAIRAYAWAEPTPGNAVFESMTKDEIMAIKELSPAKNSDFSPWNSGNDPQLWMWKKTCFKQLGKLLPTSEALSRAIQVDNVCERGGYFEKEGELVEVDFEATEDAKIDDVKAKKEKMRKKTIAK